MNTKRQTKCGGAVALTRTEVLAIVACVALSAFLLVSVLTKELAGGRRADCQNNLMQIGLAFRTWEGDFSDHYPMNVAVASGGSMQWQAGSNLFRHFAVMSRQINNPVILICPADDRQPAKSFATMSDTNLSYFADLVVDETVPQMLLTGDRNLVTNGVPVVPGLVVITAKDTVTWSAKMHHGAGNIGLADGSVQPTSSANLQGLFRASGTNVMRLAVP